MRIRILMLLCMIVCSNAEASPPGSFRIVFYNVENLFDLHRDSLHKDEEFSPGGVRRWNYTKYRRKQMDLARVIAAVGEWEVPALVGLCEVENDSVLHYLTRRTPLRESGYAYVMTESPDVRGIDVALLYQPDRFRVLEVRSIRQPADLPPTRDILHVAGRVVSGDTLDVLVCHLPSRRGGELQTEGFRRKAAATLETYTDSLARVRQTLSLVVMGDLNEPAPQKLFGGQEGRLLVLTHGEKELGSYYFGRAWETIDHFLISPSLADTTRKVSLFQPKSYIFAPDFLLHENAQGVKVPRRTYRGTFYAGGCSDHLPVYVDLTIKF
ncbi:MAG: endonuclease [Bacteroidales bacterium]